MKNIRIITSDLSVISAVLDNNPAAADLLSLLPLNVPLKDYNATEKVADLPKKLSTITAASGYKPSKGDITFYAPWGNLAIFYKGFSYSPGLIFLGRITAGIDMIEKMKSPEMVRIEIDEK